MFLRSKTRNIKENKIIKPIDVIFFILANYMIKKGAEVTEKQHQKVVYIINFNKNLIT